MFFTLGKDTTIVFKQWKTEKVWGKNILMFYFVQCFKNHRSWKAFLLYYWSQKPFGLCFGILLVRTAYHGKTTNYFGPKLLDNILLEIVYKLKSYLFSFRKYHWKQVEKIHSFQGLHHKNIFFLSKSVVIMFCTEVLYSVIMAKLNL